MEAQNYSITIKCRLRTSRNATSSLLADDFDSGSSIVGREMLCRMYQGTAETDWNLWDGETRQRTDSKNNDTQGNSSLHGQEGRGLKEDEAKISFFPLHFPPPTSTSRSFPVRPNLRQQNGIGKDAPGTNPDSRFDLDFDLPNPNRVHIPRRIIYPARAQSLDPKVNSVLRQNGRRYATPSRHCAVAAAACFAVNDKITKQEHNIKENTHSQKSQCDPLHIYCSDLISVQKDTTSNQNNGIGVIRIETNAHDIMEVIPHNIDGRDLLVAFLQSCLPKGSVQDKIFQFTKQLQCTSSDDISLDMQHFEASAVKKRFANEPIWEKMRRKGAALSSRLQEVCGNCDAATDIEVNDMMKKYKFDPSTEKDEMDTKSVSAHSTVESVLSEMELSVASREQGIKDIEEIGIITCSDTEEKTKEKLNPSSITDDTRCESNESDPARGDGCRLGDDI